MLIIKIKNVFFFNLLEQTKILKKNKDQFLE